MPAIANLLEEPITHANRCLAQLVDLKTAAAELGLQTITMRKQVENGRLEAVKVGGAWITTRWGVERYRSETLGRIGRPKGS